MGYWLAGGLTRALAPEIIELADYNMPGYSVGLEPGVDSFTGILVLLTYDISIKYSLGRTPITTSLF